MKSLLIILISFLVFEATAQEYVCSRNRYGHLDNVITVKGDMVTLKSLAGADKTIRLGEVSYLGNSDVCTKEALRGLSCPLLGTADPYEGCRVQCVETGSQAENTTVRQSDDKLFLTIERHTTTVVEKWGKDSVSSDTSKTECVRADLAALREDNRYGLKSLVLKTKDGIAWAYGDRTGDKFLDAEFKTLNMNDNQVGQPLKTKIIPMRSLFQAIGSGQISVLDLDTLTESFVLPAVMKAYCVGSNIYNQSELTISGGNVTLKPLDDQRLPNYSPEVGSVQTIDGKLMMIVGKEINPVLKIDADTFSVDGLVCHVAQ